jgi:glycosyltransferase involved in cell wall biosynthesis
MNVVFFHRKSFPGNFSIENLYDQIRNELPSVVHPKVKVLSFNSTGFFKRLFICIEAMFHQEEVNHVTGDVNFIAIFLRRKKTILTIHDIGYMKAHTGWRRLLLKWFWIVWPVKNCSAIIVVSNETKTELGKFISPKDMARVKVIYNPIGNSYIAKKKEFTQFEPVILQIGTKENKNLARLIRSISGISCRLTIVGRISESIRRELEDFKINYSNAFDLTESQMLKIYEEADIISFVSTLEGFGLPIVEGNAVGRVVVTSNISSMPEIAGNAAHLVDPFDEDSIREGFLKVIADKDYREQLIANGFENCKRFEVARIAGQYAELYRTVYANQ